MESLPAEVFFLITEKLTRIDLLNLHAVSKTLFSATDEAFADYFFGRQILYMTERSFKRLDEISEHSVYKDHIRELVLSLRHVRSYAHSSNETRRYRCKCGKDNGNDYDGTSNETREAITFEQESLIEKGRASAAMTAILTRLKHCEHLMVSCLLHRSCIDGKELPYCYRSLRADPGHRLFSDYGLSSSSTPFVQHAITVATDSLIATDCAVTTFTIELEAGRCSGVLPSTLLAVDGLQPVTCRVTNLEISVSIVTSALGESSEQLAKFVRQFPSLKRLAVNYRPRLDQKYCLAMFGELVLLGIDTLSLAGFDSTPDQLRDQIQLTEATSTVRLEIKSVALSGSLDEWESVLKVTRGWRQPRSIVLEDCSCDEGKVQFLTSESLSSRVELPNDSASIHCSRIKNISL